MFSLLFLNISFLQFHLARISPLLFHCSAQSCEFSAYYPKKIDYMYLPCLRLLIATGVVLFHNPSQTSPNCPCPSLRTNFKLPRSISHWSRVECDKSAVTGFSICKKREKRMRKMQRLLHFQKFPPSTYLFHQNYKYFLNKEERSIFICYSSHLNYCCTNEKFLQENSD